MTCWGQATTLHFHHLSSIRHRLPVTHQLRTPRILSYRSPMNTLYLAPTVSPSDSVPTSTTALFATASDSSTMSSPLPTIHRSLTCPSAIPPLSSHPTPVFKYDDVGMSRTANHTWQEPQSTDNSGAINEKNIDVPDTSVAVVWPPWKRRDGWSGWMGDTVTADSLVWSLIIQAFSTG